MQVVELVVVVVCWLLLLLRHMYIHAGKYL